MSPIPREVVVIVDPVRAGTRIPQLFNGQGYRCVSVLSDESVSDFWRASFRPQDFLHTFHEADGIESILAGLSAYEVACVLPGGESGVNLASRLGERLSGQPSLDPATAAARRDKYHMAETLRSRGLAAIPHCRTADIEVALDWLRARPDPHVVVKPLAGTSAEGVHFCDSAEAVRRAFSDLQGSVSLFGEVNQDVLVQQDILHGGGVEYTVNSASSRGRHHITDIWRMRREMVGATAVCVYSDLVHPDEPEHPALVAYCADVLTALGVRDGVGHSEIMLTRDGPVLIETGTRIEGACDPAIALQLTGHSQNSLLVPAYLDPQGFGHAITRPWPQPARQARHVYLLCPVAGPVVNPPDFGPIRRLPSFAGLDTTLDAVPALQPTVNLATCPGNLYLVAADRDRIEEDYAALRDLEKALYGRMLGAA
ncbi:ATP-grasp domain-containing protein [Micromonospora qiuiae]|uniref:ATP-grasp domain-containing protein n=1 Tax=Micromonospora qiuiae TaxID=502268 RepID=A0ABQ4JF44_9ACTN|nr:ATP-grasp domain-containing protein [Micromonospora qiuiae]GIJ28772.1 ATP-grasp domain-containing protein [Micromonospora qiuiae]